MLPPISQLSLRNLKLALLLAISLLVLLLAPSDVAKGVSGLGLADAPTIDMSISSNNVNLGNNPSDSHTSLNPFINNGLASASSTVTISTNVYAGYNFTLSTNDLSENALIPQNFTGDPSQMPKITASSGTFSNPVPLPNNDNQWGYAVAGVGGFDSSYTTPAPVSSSKWAGVPTKNNPTVIKTTVNPTTVNNNCTGNSADYPHGCNITTIHYGVKITHDLQPDEYAQTLLYTASANVDILATPAPTITSIAPNPVITNGGTTIDIVGVNFTMNNYSITTSVTIDGSACAEVNISSNTPSSGVDTIRCKVPAHAAGTVDVVVETWSSSPATGNLTYVALPKVTSVSPNFGSTAGNTTITISGSDFGAYIPPYEYEYSSCGTYYPFVASANAEYQLEVYGAQGGTKSSTLDANAKGGYSTGKVNLTAGDTLYVYVGCSGSSTGTGGWNGGGNGFSTESGSGAGASDIRLVANSDPTNLVSLQSRIIVAGGGGGHAEDGGPAGGAGGGLTGSSGGNYNSNYVAATGGSQTAGGVGGYRINYQSTSVGGDGVFGVGGNAQGTGTYKGGGGGGGWFGGGAGATYSDSSAGGGGSGYVFTSTSDKTGYNGNPPNSNYYLSDASTTGNVRTGNGLVKITNLSANPALTPSAVTLDTGGTPANCAIISWSNTQIKCNNSAHSAGTVNVTVSSGGQSSVDNGTSDDFTYKLPPTITSVSPASGSTAGGTLITITGISLANATNVNICNSISTNTDSQITCTTKPNAAGTINVIVTNNVGASSDNGTNDDFTYIAPSQTPKWVKAAANTAAAKSSIAGASAASFTVDIDANMIPVVNLNTDGYYPSNWCNYDEKQWCNAVTVKSSTLAAYQSAATGTEVAEDDILGYYVYVPRYAYEVQRYYAFNKPTGCGGNYTGSASALTCANISTSGANSGLGESFDIRFEKATTTKKIPYAGNAACKLMPTSTTGWTALDYRTECGASRTYGAATGTTWATHPAFTFGTTELNGIWIGKFETTGTNTNPTIKPNSHANVNETIGEFFQVAESIAVNDPNISGGSTPSPALGTQNSHNLATHKTHMAKNSEWGATAYLSYSVYGAGVNKVQPNTALPTNSADADGTLETNKNLNSGITGCGPSADNNFSAYTDGAALSTTVLSSPTACSSSNTQRAYNGTIGQLASTTNNTYGVYDMAAGGDEFVVGYAGLPSATYMSSIPTGSYIDNYGIKNDVAPSWSARTMYSSYYNVDHCAFTAVPTDPITATSQISCGGHAIFEISTVQSSTSDYQGWGYKNNVGFVSTQGPWFSRGGGIAVNNGTGNNGILYMASLLGSASASSTFRVVMISF